MGKLTKFQGSDVVATTIAVTHAGDGLSQALAVEPAEYRHGEKVYVVLETEVAKVGFVPSKDDEHQLVRVHTLRAGTSTIVDQDLVAGVLQAQREKNKAAADAASGQTTIDLEVSE